MQRGPKFCEDTVSCYNWKHNGFTQCSLHLSPVLILCDLNLLTSRNTSNLIQGMEFPNPLTVPTPVVGRMFPDLDKGARS